MLLSRILIPNFRMFTALSWLYHLTANITSKCPVGWVPVSGVARPFGLGGHTCSWVSAARLAEDKKGKGHNFPSRRCQFVTRILRFEIIPVCLLCTTAIESRHRYFSKVGYTTGISVHVGIKSLLYMHKSSFCPCQSRL